jgi:hypothetical protein
VFSQKKRRSANEVETQRDVSMQRAARWSQGYRRVLTAETAAAVASSHEPFCGCLACRVSAHDPAALREFLDGPSRRG